MAGRRGVAVAGTHGKTSTTSMLTVALQHCGARPVVRDRRRPRPRPGANATTATGDVFVAEADESDGSFLLLSPGRRGRHQRRGRPPRPLRHAPRPSVAALRRSSLGRIDPGGFLVACADDPGAGAPPAPPRARGLRARPYGAGRGATCGWPTLLLEVAAGRRGRGRCSTGRRRWRRCGSPVPGEHMALNAAAALLAGARARRSPADCLVEGLAGFAGVRRRFELRGRAGGVARVRRLRPPPDRGRRAAAGRPRRSPGPGGCVVAFQPHLYCRTRRSPGSSAPRSGWPTRSSCWTSTARGRTRCRA